MILDHFSYTRPWPISNEPVVFKGSNVVDDTRHILVLGPIIISLPRLGWFLHEKVENLIRPHYLMDALGLSFCHNYCMVSQNDNLRLTIPCVHMNTRPV